MSAKIYNRYTQNAMLRRPAAILLQSVRRSHLARDSQGWPSRRVAESLILAESPESRVAAPRLGATRPTLGTRWGRHPRLDLAMGLHECLGQQLGAGLLEMSQCLLEFPGRVVRA